MTTIRFDKTVTTIERVELDLNYGIREGIRRLIKHELDRDEHDGCDLSNCYNIPAIEFLLELIA